MDQRVTVYIQQGAMNGSISDGGRMIALSVSNGVRTISVPSFQGCKEHNIF